MAGLVGYYYGFQELERIISDCKQAVTLDKLFGLKTLIVLVS